MNLPLSLRRVGLLVTASCLLAAAGFAGEPAQATPGDLETLRKQVLAEYLGRADQEAARRLAASIAADGSWPGIDYKEASRSAWAAPEHLGRVATLARAFRAPASPLEGNREILVAALRGLDFWLNRDPQNPNWWWNEIGVPSSLLPILLMLDGELSPSQREAGLKILGRAKIGMTGQNLVWVTEITAGRGLLERDAALVSMAYRRIADEICIGLEEGIQPDYSFHQHGPCLYSHGYGAAYITDCSRLAALLNGTGLALPPEKIAILSNLILDGTQWMARGAATDFGAEGREITRKGQSARYLERAAETMLRLPTGRDDEFRQLAARMAGQKGAPPLVGNRHFWRADLMTHHRPAYYASARMHSTRLANTDGPANSEGLLSHHLADGCFVLMRAGGEYEDIFGVWDWQKIPGTTVEQKRELAGSPRRMGTTDFVGGASDGTYGLAACDFARQTLTAHKSWTFFDDEIVCLGAGITSTAGLPVLTTLNQCALRGEVVAGDGNGSRALPAGEHEPPRCGWLWHDSAAYVLLDPAALHIENRPKRGAWWSCNRRYSQKEEERDLFTVWIDHGRSPSAAGYAYLVAPQIDRDAVAAYAARPPIRIIANSARLQSVRHERLAVTSAAFYEPGAVELSRGLSIRVDTPCLLLAREDAGKLTVTVSNPKNQPALVRVDVGGGPGKAEPRQMLFQLPGGLRAGSSVSLSIDR